MRWEIYLLQKYFRQMKLIVNGEEFIVESSEKSMMEYFTDLEAIEGKESESYTLDHLDAASVSKVLKLMRVVNCQFPQFGKVKSGDAKEYIGNSISDFLNELSNNEVNALFRVAHFLKIQGMVKCIAAFMACKVYIPLNLEAYNSKMVELKIKQQLTNQVSQGYRTKYTFL